LQKKFKMPYPKKRNRVFNSHEEQRKDIPRN
jgi:hypothetical protein